ncbi:MAG: molecular chaperone DnaK [Acidimicrobiaceae bacterium]|nr:MAG: molecular chaperone DnaK [Acidimicrobiaceae bacterium]
MIGVSSAPLRPRLGIDLGTIATTAVLGAARDSASAATIVELDEHGAATASAIAIGRDGLVFGVAADKIIAAQPDHGARELKRRFGDTTPVVLDGRPFSAEELTTEVLRAITRAAGIDPASTALTLTHPANWREYKLDLLGQVAAQAGFSDVELISEPVAAARHYASTGHVAIGDTVAVYDFGGTFDAAVVTISASGPQVIGTPQGLERLGGVELDQVVFGHVAETLGGTLQQLDRNDADVRQAVLQLRAECNAAKERLSSEAETSIKVVAPGLDTQVRMTRDEFELALRPRIAETLNALDRAIATADLKPSDLAAVVLIGGSSRIPLVAEMVAGHLGRPVLNDSDPALVVALGAASGPSAPRLAVAPTSTSVPDPTSAADPTSASPRETNMSDQPNSSTGSTPDGAPPSQGSGPAAPGGAGGRSVPPPPPAAPKRGASKAAKLAGGAAAVAAAVAAGVVYGDDLVEAAGGDDDGSNAEAAAAGAAAAAAAASATADDAEFRTADQMEREVGGDDADRDESMDAFDTDSGTEGGFAASSADPVSGPLGTPLGSQFAAPDSAGSFSAAQRQAPRPEAPQQQPAPRRVDTQPTAAPSGDEAPAAGAPATSASASAAAAAPAASAVPAAAAAPAADAEFEAARATLLERLEHFEAPEGTSPEDAQELRDELQDAVERFQVAPGQSTEDALAALRDDYDQRVQDFTQDQKIDALVREAQRDNADDADPAPVEVAPVEVVPVEVELVTGIELVDVGPVKGDDTLPEGIEAPITDVRWSPPAGDRPVMVVDVVGDSTYAEVVEKASELGDPVEAALSPTVAIQREITLDEPPTLGIAPVEEAMVLVGLNLADAGDFTEKEVDFATDIASDISPDSPTTLSFDP